MSKKIIEYDDFIKLLTENFPEIKEEIIDEDYDGLLSLQIGVFRTFTQNAINKGDTSQIDRCFKFINSLLGNVEHKVENSIYMSYFSKLDFEANPTVKKLLSKEILKNIEAIGQHERSAGDDPKLKDFLNSLDN